MIRQIWVVVMMLVCLGASTVCMAAPAVEVTAKGNRGLRMAVVAPQPTSGTAHAELADTVASIHAFDMTMAGVVQPEITSQPLLARGLVVSDTDFSRWATAGYELMVRGEYSLHGDSLVLELRLYDVIGRKMLTAKRYTGRSADVRKVAHLFSDEVVRVLTGEKGSFSSRIVFIATQSGTKELHLMDWDGFNTQRLTNHRAIMLSPDVAPNGKAVLFTSYKRGNPDIYVRQLSEGTESLLSGRKGLNITGAWSPDGKQVAVTLSMDGSTDIYLLDTQGRNPQRLTHGAGANISPTWSPDSKQIAFISDRHGKPNLFVMNRDGSHVRKLAGGAYLATPSWSPKGDQVAFTKLDGGFQVCVVTLDGAVRQLTQAGNNERPRWSPDGRLLAFGSKRNGQEAVYVMRADGGGQTRVSKTSGLAQHPVWLP